MRIRAISEVRSHTELPGTTTVEKNGRRFTFVANDKGLLGEIQIEALIARPERFSSEIVATPSSVSKATVIHRADEELLESLRADFQLLEALLSLQGVRSVKWSAHAL
jgi:hypothetical protein